MIDIVIAFDEQDASLGSYFEACKRDIVALLDEQQHLVKSISPLASTQCNAAYIDIYIPIFNPNPFIFIAYSHGINNGLRCNGGSYVSADSSVHFNNALFYSTACLIGKELAPELIRNGCRAFVGFKEESEVFKDTYRQQTFIECDNYAFKMFMTSDATLGQAFESMKNHYTNKIDYLMDIGEDPLFIGALTANREALICLGDKNVRKEDFFVD